MPKYKVEHLVLCEVSTERWIEAESMDEALVKVAGIETVTCSGECEYEIVSDRAVLSVSIEEK